MMQSTSSSSRGPKPPTKAGATSVWVGTRPAAKDSHRLHTNMPSHTVHNSTEEDRKGRQTVTRPQVNNNGQYVVVSVKDSTSDISINKRKNSTVIPPSGTVISPSEDVNPVSGAVISQSGTVGPSSNGSSIAEFSASNGYNCSQNALLSSASFPLSTGIGSFNFPWQVNQSLSNLTLGGGSGNFLNNASNGLGNNSNIFSNYGFGLNSNALYNTGNIYGNINPLYSFTSGLASSLPSLPQTNYENTLLLQQPYGLNVEPCLASSGLLQSTSLQDLIQFQSTSQPLWKMSQPQLLMPSMSYFGQSFDTLSASLPLDQSFLSQSGTSTFFPDQQLLPQSTTTSGGLSSVANISATGQEVTLEKPPPPLLNQHPAKMYQNKRKSLKATEKRSMTATQTPADDRAHEHFFKLSGLDQTYVQTSSGLRSPFPASSSSISTSSEFRLNTVDNEASLQEVTVKPCYHPPIDMDACMRCGKKVYAMERLGPVKHVLYHKACFTCRVCNTVLSLKNYCHNDADINDLSVYCTSHRPTARPNPLDHDPSFNVLQRALSVP